MGRTGSGVVMTCGSTVGVRSCPFSLSLFRSYPGTTGPNRTTSAPYAPKKWAPSPTAKPPTTTQITCPTTAGELSSPTGSIHTNPAPLRSRTRPSHSGTAYHQRAPAAPVGPLETTLATTSRRTLPATSSKIVSSSMHTCPPSQMRW